MHEQYKSNGREGNHINSKNSYVTKIIPTVQIICQRRHSQNSANYMTEEEITLTVQTIRHGKVDAKMSPCTEGLAVVDGVEGGARGAIRTAITTRMTVHKMGQISAITLF